MRRLSLLILLIALFSVQPVLARIGPVPARQETASLSIFLSAPLGGQALQGLVEIRGNTAVENFQSANLTFAYHGDTTGTWFLIHESDAPVANDILAQWDTTRITDGNYDLRLSVRLTDGNQIIVTVQGLRVRNYSAVETDTPTPPTATATSLPTEPGDVIAASPTPSATPTSTDTITPVPPTVTPLPTNPAELSREAILNTLSKGGIATLAIFALLGTYLGGRAVLRRPRKQPKP